jgi:hypothetical protein
MFSRAVAATENSTLSSELRRLIWGRFGAGMPAIQRPSGLIQPNPQVTSFDFAGDQHGQNRFVVAVQGVGKHVAAQQGIPHLVKMLGPLSAYRLEWGRGQRWRVRERPPRP